MIFQLKSLLNSKGDIYKVDAEIVVGILRKDLNDFVDFRNVIVSFLKSDNNK